MAASTAGSAPLEVPPLRESEIHVWAVDLDRPPVDPAELRRCLSADERARSSRLKRENDRVRFRTGRALRRWILGAYVGVPPRELTFTIGPRGKPSLEEGLHGERPLQFNVSDSAGHLLLGVGDGAPIGVDVERIQPVRDVLLIAGRFFADAEADLLASLPEEQRMRAFHECWTRKEAFVKAVGEGLAIPLDAFEVSFGPAAPPAFLTIAGSSEEAARWSLWGFDVGADAVAAVAVRDRRRSLLLCRWVARHNVEIETLRS